MEPCSAQKFYPSCGWGYTWSGDPDKGYGRSQPGGWIYNSLPFLEETNIHDMGKGLTGAAKKTELGRMQSMPVPVFICPTRRVPKTYPVTASETSNASNDFGHAKTDYAGNGGEIVQTWSGPAERDEGHRSRLDYEQHRRHVCDERSSRRRFPMALQRPTGRVRRTWNRVTTTRAVERPTTAACIRGTIGTFSAGDIRTCHPRPTAVGSMVAYLAAASEGCYFAFCDGSVQFISYEISGETHRRLSNRHDALPTPDWN